MKNYSNPYQAPVLEMISATTDESGVLAETITDIYDSRVEPGFRALFAGIDGWYDIYRDSEGNYIKQKVGSNSGSGDIDLANYYNKDQTVELVDNKINEAVIIKQGNDGITLDSKVKRYYFLASGIGEYNNYFSLLSKESNIEDGTWEFVILGEYYDSSSQSLPFYIIINNVYTYQDRVNNKSMKTILCTARQGLVDFTDITPATKEELSQIPKFNVSVVEELPTENISNTTVYLVTGTKTEDNNLYEEYIYIKDEDQWELLGTQTSDINLDNYYTKEEINNKGYLTEIPSEYVTQTELDDKDYAKTSDIPTKVSELENDAQYLDSFEQSIEDIVALSGFYYTFEANHVYKVKIDSLQEKVQFYFSTPSNDEIVNQILIYLDNTTLGDSQPFLWSYENISPEFINGEEPTIGKARYRILAEYNPYSENWVVGVVPDGKVLE